MTSGLRTSPTYAPRLVALGLLALASGCAKPEPGSAEPHSPPSDGDRLQGVWKIESFQTDELRPSRSELNRLRLQFEGDLLASVRDGRYVAMWKYSVDATQNPPVINLARHRDERVGQSIGPEGRWLYKFEGAHLILATPPDARTNPAGVQARESVVLTLSKTDEPLATEWDSERLPPTVIPPATPPGRPPPNEPKKAP